MAEKGGAGDHEGVAKATEVSVILHFFSEDIRRIYFSRNMLNGDGVVGLGFPNRSLAEVDVFGALVGEGDRPVDVSLVIVEEGVAGSASAMWRSNAL